MYYDNITLNWDDADVERTLNRIALANELENFHEQMPLLYFRNQRGELDQEQRGAKNALYQRNPKLGNLLCSHRRMPLKREQVE